MESEITNRGCTNEAFFPEENMVPEFGIPKNVDEGVFEEQVCWECCVAQMMKFHEMGIKILSAVTSMI